MYSKPNITKITFYHSLDNNIAFSTSDVTTEGLKIKFTSPKIKIMGEYYFNLLDKKYGLILNSYTLNNWKCNFIHLNPIFIICGTDEIDPDTGRYLKIVSIPKLPLKNLSCKLESPLKTVSFIVLFRKEIRR